MATKRKSSGRSGESGSTLYGALAGLLIGLIVAAVVAFYVTKAPVPSWTAPAATPASCQTRARRRIPTPACTDATARRTPPSGPTATTPAPLPGTGTAGADTPPSVRRPGRADRHVADLNNKPAAAAVAPTPPRPIRCPRRSPRSRRRQPRRPRPARRRHRRPPRHRPTALSAGRRLPQRRRRRIAQGPHHPAGPAGVGAEGRSQRQALNRVRVGPYARLDDMNRARGRLGENKIETAVVRQ